MEIDEFFSLVGVFTNLKRCKLQLDNLKKLVLMSKNWPNDARVGCKAPNNLIDFESNLKYELNEFESSFERDELKEN
jgi:hypothetical protein